MNRKIRYNLQKHIAFKCICVLSLIMTFGSVHLFSQDVHFSQFYANPLLLNPAQTAWYDGDIRVNCMYRTQWKAIDNKPFNTISASVEKQLQFYDHTYGFGLQFVNDKSGYVGLNVNKIMTSGAFAIHLNGHKLSGGVQLGLVMKNTNVLDYSYDNQFDYGGESVFNKGLESGEEDGSALFHATINAGVIWQKQLSQKFTPEVGLSLFNLNMPYESLQGVQLDETRQPLKICVQVAGNYQVTDNVSIKPNILYMTYDRATDFLLGANCNYSVNSDFGLYAGTLVRYGWAKNFDASVWILGAKFKQFDVGVSYDVNLSSLRSSSHYRGAFEVSLTYISPSLKTYKVTVPCERM